MRQLAIQAQKDRIIRGLLDTIAKSDNPANGLLVKNESDDETDSSSLIVKYYADA
jgi:hypothetical protein